MDIAQWKGKNSTGSTHFISPIPKIKKAVAHLTKLVASASQILVSSQSINMPYTNGTYHRRADNQICGSEKNHSKTQWVPS